MNSPVKVKVILLLGSNCGDRFHHIDNAEKLIAKFAGKIIESSSLYETTPWGFTEQPDFLNKITVIETSLEPLQLLKQLKNIEKKSGRIKTEKWRERILDIDILYYDTLILNSEELTIPHPLLHERKFTLMPLNEILPDYVHPVFHKKTTELLKNCTDTGNVKNLHKHLIK